MERSGAMSSACPVAFAPTAARRDQLFGGIQWRCDLHLQPDRRGVMMLRHYTSVAGSVMARMCAGRGRAG